MKEMRLTHRCHRGRVIHLRPYGQVSNALGDKHARCTPDLTKGMETATLSGKLVPGLQLDLDQKGLEVFLY